MPAGGSVTCGIGVVEASTSGISIAGGGTVPTPGKGGSTSATSGATEGVAGAGARCSNGAAGAKAGAIEPWPCCINSDNVAASAKNPVSINANDQKMRRASLPTSHNTSMLQDQCKAQCYIQQALT